MSTKRLLKNMDDKWARFKAMVHYICDSFSNEPARLGKVKLQKILWFSDREAYLKLGSTISGVNYVKMPEGPATPRLDKAIEELQREKKIRVRQIANGPYQQYAFISLD